MAAGKRKSLTRSLGTLSHLSVQQLPFYARLIAALSQYFPDMGASVCDAVARSAKGTTKSKDASSRLLETRIKAARYLCELTKFRLMDPGAHSCCQAAKRLCARGVCVLTCMQKYFMGQL